MPIPKPETTAKKEDEPTRAMPLSHYISWSELLRRTFQIDTLCARCKTPLRLISVIKTGETIKGPENYGANASRRRGRLGAKVKCHHMADAPAVQPPIGKAYGPEKSIPDPTLPARVCKFLRCYSLAMNAAWSVRTGGLPAAAAMAAVVAMTSSALALDPCPVGCHLAQGQPVYLADSKVLFVTRCDSTGTDSTCVTEKLDSKGKTIERLAKVPHMYGEDMFESKHLYGHTVVQLSWQTPWKDLQQPYRLDELFTGQRLKLSLTGSTLTCKTSKGPVVRRDFGCRPDEIRVYAPLSSEGRRNGPVVLVGLCPGAEKGSIHEAVATCTSERVRP